MTRKKIIVKNPAGLLLQSAGRLCEEASRYEADIQIDKNHVKTNAKSLLAVLGACIRYGDEIEFICEGKDEKEALQAMVRLAEKI